MNWRERQDGRRPEAPKPDLATQISSLRNAIDDLNVGFQKSVREIVIPHPVSLGEKAFERMDEIIGQLLGIREAVSKVGQNSQPGQIIELLEKQLYAAESLSTKRHEQILLRLDHLPPIHGEVEITSRHISDLKDWSTQGREAITEAILRWEKWGGEVRQQVEKATNLLAQHLAAQKQLARTIEGRQDDEDQELIERALAVKAEHPEMMLEECIVRVRRAMAYRT